MMLQKKDKYTYEFIYFNLGKTNQTSQLSKF